jgi:monothiol glutaredoxin
VASAFRAPKPFFTPVQIRLLSEQTRQAIDKAVGSARVVLFMKGTPETPQCGFSRASIQVLGMQGVDPAKFAAFNVLEDAELRSGMFSWDADIKMKRLTLTPAGIKEYSDWPTIPQLYVDKEFIGGCDILVSMHQNGELAKLLEEKKVLVEGESEGETGKQE